MGRAALSTPALSTSADVSGAADPSGLSPRVRALLWTAFLGVALAALIALIPLPYAILRPGPAMNTLGHGPDDKPLVAVSGAPVYPTSGALDFTTVRVGGGPGRRINAWDLLGAWLSPSAEIFPQDEIFPKGSTSEQIQEQNTAAMTGSQREATAVALRSLGKPVKQILLIASVDPKVPAAKVLRDGDVIDTIEGVAADSLSVIQDRVRRHTAGESVRVVVKRNGSRVPVSVTTTSIDGVTALGVRLASDYDFPYEVRIDAGDVGGPSAGTMFALAIRDVLTPGAMTGGKKIAGTGTIDDDGTVGPIGGIRQKVAGAKDAGAAYFLAPAANCADLRDHQPKGIQVVRVATYTEAVSAVESIAKGATDALPSCS